MTLPDLKKMNAFDRPTAFAAAAANDRMNPSGPLGNVLFLNLQGCQLQAARASLQGSRCRMYERCDSADALTEIFTGSVHLVVLNERGAVRFCRTVRNSHPHQLLPILVVGETYNAETEVALLEAGADAYLAGPSLEPVLRARIVSCLRRKALTDSMDDTETILFTLAHSVEERDPALGEHCERLSFMAAATGIALGLGSDEIISLQRGGFLHDIGKVAIPDSVLFKPGPLTVEEWEVMKSHPERGERICTPVRSLSPVLPIIRSHHEKWDGSGYPDNRKGTEIPLLSRILQLADIYDALTTARPYKRAFTSSQAVQVMEEEVQKGWRDPELSRLFFQLVPFFEHPDTAPLSQLSLGALAASMGRFRNLAVVAERSYEKNPVRMASGL